MPLKPGCSARPRLEAMLSKAIESNKQRELTYVRQATIDALTGCKNRRAFDSDIAALMNDHQPFSLALVDIDNFKTINDTWGHLNGDIVLRNVAREGLQILQPCKFHFIATAAKSLRCSSPPGIAMTLMLLESWRERVAQRSWREGTDGNLQRGPGRMEYGAPGAAGGER
jgi:hypothetical protein